MSYPEQFPAQAQQQHYPAQPVYGQPPQQHVGQPSYAGQATYPGQATYARHSMMTACRLCGCVPAVETKFRGHQGMLVIMRFLSTDGPFCRDCGLGVFRQMTSRTLVQGWYGYASTIITPITVLMNIVRRGKVARLAPPQRHPHQPSQAPMNPGPRLLERPMTWIGLCIPFAVIALIVAINTAGG